MKAQCLSLDRISTLPSVIIETILCHVSIKDAAKTSVLSRDWRYKWTHIPKLKFLGYKFEESTNGNQPSFWKQKVDVSSQRKNLTKRSNLFYAIYQVLLLHQGPIHEFTCSTTVDRSCAEIDQIILYLSRNNTLKKLKLSFSSYGEYKLPLSVFSLNQLTDIHLHMCHLDHPPTFDGFGSLTSLFLRCVKISTKTLLQILSKSPLLKDLSLLIDDFNIIGDDVATLTELFKYSPLIEKLCIYFGLIECFAEDGVPQVLPTRLVHLKQFTLQDMCYIDEYGSPFLSLILRSSPNLEKLFLTMYHDTSLDTTEIESVTLKDYSDIRLEHLNEFQIVDMHNLKHELEFVKLILTKSPMLKKVSISVDPEISKDEEMLISRNLLHSPRASPLACIVKFFEIFASLISTQAVYNVESHT